MLTKFYTNFLLIGITVATCFFFSTIFVLVWPIYFKFSYMLDFGEYFGIYIFGHAFPLFMHLFCNGECVEVKKHLVQYSYLMFLFHLWLQLIVSACKMHVLCQVT